MTKRSDSGNSYLILFYHNIFTDSVYLRPKDKYSLFFYMSSIIPPSIKCNYLPAISSLARCAMYSKYGILYFIVLLGTNSTTSP